MFNQMTLYLDFLYRNLITKPSKVTLIKRVNENCLLQGGLGMAIVMNGSEKLQKYGLKMFKEVRLV